ncbi:hypothetical protein ACJ41O_015340 [Fusarium nematophilum]
MSTQVTIVLAERPQDDIIPGKTFQERIQPRPTPEDLKDGELLVENLYLSIDPAMRAWINETATYMEPVEVGSIMRGATVARVLASKSAKAKEGDIIPTWSGWQEYAVIKEAAIEPASSLPRVQRPSDYLSGIGTTSVTGYLGMLRVGKPKAGETVLVSGAAGATGSIAGQVAKILGAKVVGTAGSDEKCRWLKEELGFDEAINYKDTDFADKLKKATPDLIDVYFDNVGGEILNLALKRANTHARFIICGGISGYGTDTSAASIKNYLQILTKRVTMQGYLVFDDKEHWPDARKQLAQWLEEGKLKRQETIVKGGLRVADRAIIDMYKGANTGKMLVEIKGTDAGE